MLFEFFRHDVAQVLRRAADFVFVNEDNDDFVLHLAEWPPPLVAELIKHAKEQSLELEVAIASLLGLSLHILIERAEEFNKELRDLLDSEVDE